MPRKHDLEDKPASYEDDQSPYHWPRGVIVGSRAGQHAAQALAVVLFIAMVVVFIVMVTHHP